MSDRFIFEDSYRLIQKKFETRDFHFFLCEKLLTKQNYLLCLLKKKIRNFEAILEKLQKIKHKNLIEILHYAEENEQQYIIIDDFDGQFLRYEGILEDRSYQKLCQLSRTLFDIYELSVEEEFSTFVFSSQYIIKSMQGEFRFFLFQPLIWNYLQDKQLSLFVESESKRLFWNRSEITETVLIEDRWYSLLFIWLESILEDDFIEGFLKQEEFLFKRANEHVKEGFKSLAPLLNDLSNKKSELKSLLSQLMKQSNFFRSDAQQIFKKLFQHDIEHFLLSKQKKGKYHYLVSANHITEYYFASLFKREVEELNKSFFSYDAEEEVSGDYHFVYSILKHFGGIDENFNHVLEKVFPLTKKNEKEELHNLLNSFSNMENREQSYLFIFHPDKLDRKSKTLLKHYPKLWKTLNIELFMLSDMAEFNRFQNNFDLNALNLTFLAKLNSKETEYLIQAELNCDLVQARMLYSRLNPHYRNEISALLELLDWLKLDSSWNFGQAFSQEQLQKIDVVQNISNLAETKISRLKQYKELLLFFSFLSKGIPLRVLEKAFTAQGSLEPLLDFLLSKRLLKKSLKNAHFFLNDIRYKELIINAFDPTLTLAIISQFKSMSELKAYFDFQTAITTLFQLNKKHDAIEVLLKYANFLKQERSVLEAIEIYEKILDSVKRFSIDLDKRIHIQVLQSLIQLLAQENQFERAYLHLNELLEILKNDSKEEPYFRLIRFDLLLAMDKQAELQEEELTAFHSEKNEDEKYRNLILAKYYAHKKDYTKAFDVLEKNLGNSESEQAELELSLSLKIKFLEERNDFAEKRSCIELIRNKKRKLVREVFVLDQYFSFALDLFAKKQLNEAETIFKECLKLSDSTNKAFRSAEIYSYLAAILVLKDAFHPAIELYQKSAELFETLFEEEKRAYVYGNLSILYKDLGKISLAIHYEEKAQELFKSLGRSDEVIYSLANIGHIHFLLFNFDDAESYLREAKNLAQTLNKASAFCHASLYLSALESLKGKNKEASKLLLDTLNLLPKNDKENYIHYSYYKAFYDYQFLHYKAAKNDLLLIIESDMLKDNKKYNFIFLYLLASVLIKLNDKKNGEELLEKALASAIRQENVIYQLLINIRLYEFYVENEKEAYRLCEKNINRLVNQIASSIDDDVLKVSFLQSRFIKQFNRIAL